MASVSLLRRRRRAEQQHAQRRPRADQPEAAAQRAPAGGQRHRSAAASRTSPRGRRRHPLHAAGAGPDHRRQCPSRTQYQFVAGRRRPRSCWSTTGPGSWCSALKQGAPALARRRHRHPGRGPWRPIIEVDRDTAARLGDQPASAVDDALYDAFGQRIVSTIFTQANQYRVILEAAPDVHRQHRRPGATSTCSPAPASRCR